MNELVKQLKEEILGKETTLHYLDNNVKHCLKSNSSLWENEHLAIENKSWTYWMENDIEVNVVFEIIDNNFDEEAFYNYELDYYDLKDLKIKVITVEEI